MKCHNSSVRTEERKIPEASEDNPKHNVRNFKQSTEVKK